MIPRTPLPAGTRPILALAVSPDDALVACSRANRLSIYDLRGPFRSAELVDPGLVDAGVAAAGWSGAAHEDLIRSLAFARQGDLLASGGFRTVKLWRRPRGALDREIRASQPTRSMAVGPDGKLLALGAADGTIDLLDLAGAAPPKVLAKHDGGVTALAFAPDGGRLYSAGLDRTLRAWTLPGGSAAGKLAAPAEVRALAVLGGGTQLATGDADNVIRVWPTATLVLQPPAAAPKLTSRELRGHNKAITSLAVVPATPILPAVPAVPATSVSAAVAAKPAIPAAPERLLSGGEDGRGSALGFDERKSDSQLRSGRTGHGGRGQPRWPALDVGRRQRCCPALEHR